MAIRQRKLPRNAQIQQALDDIGGEALEGSGFEGELPEPEFTEREVPVETPPS